MIIIRGEKITLEHNGVNKDYIQIKGENLAGSLYGIAMEAELEEEVEEFLDVLRDDLILVERG